MAKDVVAISAPTDFKDWIPVRVFEDGSDRMVDWCYAGATRFTQPFYTDTVREILRRPFSALFRRTTSIESLPEIGLDALPPAGFIFHMSRCGSTLVAQMLAAVDSNLVISEAPAIDDVLQLSRTEYEITRREYLRSIVSALCRPRGVSERRCFIKFDSWHTLDLDLIASTFPDVPWIFLYRDPVEVIVSHMRQRGLQMIPGVIGGLTELSIDDSLKMSAEEYCARVLAPICASSIQHARDRNGMLVNYAQLPDVVFDSVVDHFGVSFAEDEIESMKNAAQFNAKTPQLFFEKDVEEKQREASLAVRDAANTVRPHFEKLESARLARQGAGR